MVTFSLENFGMDTLCCQVRYVEANPAGQKSDLGSHHAIELVLDWVGCFLAVLLIKVASALSEACGTCDGIHGSQ
jgi:hypothetical protein